MFRSALLALKPSATELSLIRQAQRLAESAGRFLQQHGIPSDLQADAREPAEAILSRANAGQYGMLVMGAFGERWVTERLFGSVTKTILQELPMTVFLDYWCDDDVTQGPSDRLL